MDKALLVKKLEISNFDSENLIDGDKLNLITPGDNFNFLLLVIRNGISIRLFLLLIPTSDIVADK